MKITIDCTDEAGEELLKILNYLKECGDVGHLAELYDPQHLEDGNGYIGCFDGDGPSQINAIYAEAT